MKDIKTIITANPNASDAEHKLRFLSYIKSNGLAIFLLIINWPVFLIICVICGSDSVVAHCIKVTKEKRHQFCHKIVDWMYKLANKQ